MGHFDRAAVLSMLLLIGFGTCSSLLSKILVSTKAEGTPPDMDTKDYYGYYDSEANITVAGWINGSNRYQKFSKSFSISFIMFIGMFLVYPSWIAYMFIQAKREGRPFVFPKRTFLQFLCPLLPSVCDCTATTLNMYALRYVDASTEGMLSGSQIVFTAILSFFFLKKKIWLFQLIAIVTAVVALVLIGGSEVLKSKFEGSDDEEETSTVSSSQRFLGVVLIIIAFFVGSIQNVFLEKILEGLEPLEIVGLQGFWGMLVVSFICLPAVYYIPTTTPYPGSDLSSPQFPDYRPGKDSNDFALTSFESILDTFDKVKNSQKIAALYFVYLFILFFFNIGVIAVVNYTSALNYTIVVTVRSLLVWIILLIIGHTVGEELRQTEYAYSEIWSRASWMQLSGFILNLVATVINNRFYEFPCLPYPEFRKEAAVEPADEDMSDSKKNSE